MAVPPLDVQARVVVEQVVGDCYVALENRGTDNRNCTTQSLWRWLDRDLQNAFSHLSHFGQGKSASIQLVLTQSSLLFLKSLSVQSCVFSCASVSALAPNCQFVCVCVCACVFVTERRCVCVTKPVSDKLLCPFVCGTCLGGGDERCIPLAVLPVDIQIRTLRERYDDVHEALITGNQQSYLRQKVTDRDG